MQVPRDWWKSFFNGPALDAWREITTPELTLAEVEIVERALRIERGMHLLDVPCGNGRHAVELGRRGYRVTGVDQSEEFVAEGRAAAVEQGVEIELRVGDMRDLPCDGRHDAAFSMGNSFGYMDDAGNREFLCRVAASLRPGGGFLLHTGVAAESVLSGLSSREWHGANGSYLLMQSDYDLLRGRLNTRYTFVGASGCESRDASYRIYTLRQLCEMFSEAGFDAIEPLDGRDGTPFGVGSPELFLLARAAPRESGG